MERICNHRLRFELGLGPAITPGYKKYFLEVVLYVFSTELQNFAPLNPKSSPFFKLGFYSDLEKSDLLTKLIQVL